jgi:AraC-like DNA-binding protein
MPKIVALLRRAFLWDYISGNAAKLIPTTLTPDIVRERYDIHIAGDNFACFIIKADCAEPGLFDEEIANTLEQLLTAELLTFGGDAFVYRDGGVFYAVLCADRATAISANSGGNEILSCLSEPLDENVTLTGAVASVDRLGEIGNTLTALRSSVDERIIYGAGKMYRLHPERFSSNSRQFAAELSDWYRPALANAMDSIRPNAVEVVVVDVFTRLRRISLLNPTEFYLAARELTERAKLATAYCEAELALDFDVLSELIDNMNTVPELEQLLTGSLTAISGKYQNMLAAEGARPVRNAKKYIDEHYREKTTIQVVANEVGLNTTYLSDLFKKQTGQTIIEYVTSIRINAAKELLRTTDLTAPLVAEAVGYRDIKHFNDIFQRTAGVTPGKFRRLYK